MYAEYGVVGVMVILFSGMLYWFRGFVDTLINNKMEDLELDKMAAVYPWGDVFFLGHNHQLYAKPMDSIVVDNNNEETLRRRWYIRGGSFLRYADYARYSFYPLVRTGWVSIEFSDSGIKCREY